MTRFFTDKQIKYFTENENALIRYLFFHEFPEYSEKGNLSEENLMHVFRENLGFLLKRNRNGYAGSVQKWDKISKGTLWNLYVYIMLGFSSSEPFIAKSIEYLNTNFILPSGGFSFGWTPKSESSLWSGEYLYLLLKSGYRENEIHGLKKWLVSSQNSDGGWFVSPVKSVSDALRFVLSGKIRDRETNTAESRSCVFSTVSCLQALVEYNSIFGSGAEDAIKKAAYFLINEQVLFDNRLESLDGFAVNRNFHSIGISMFGQIDIVKYLDIMSRTPYKMHEFVIPAYNFLVKEKKFEEGWIFSSKADQMLEKELAIRRFSGIDYVATLKILKVLKRYD